MLRSECYVSNGDLGFRQRGNLDVMWWPEREMTSSREQGTLWTLLTTITTAAITSPAVNVSTQQNLTPTHTHTHSFPLSVWGNQTRSALLLPNSVGPICSSCCSADTRARVPLFSHFSGSLYHFFTVAGCVTCCCFADDVGQRCVALNLVMHVRFLVAVVVESALVIESLMFFP